MSVVVRCCAVAVAVAVAVLPSRRFASVMSALGTAVAPPNANCRDEEGVPRAELGVVGSPLSPLLWAEAVEEGDGGAGC